MTNMGRLHNMAKWALLFIESFLFLGIPSEIAIPYSTTFLMDTKQINMKKLRSSERQAIANHVIITGFASMIALLGFGFGLFGKYTPYDVYGIDGDNPISIILNKRKKNTCCICLESFTLDDTVRVLKCKHCYHKRCLDGWIKQNKTCPICRHGV